MYELPELEVIRVFVTEKFAGATITKIQANSKCITSKKAVINEELISATIWFVERKLDHLIFHLDTGKRLAIKLGNDTTIYAGEAGEKLASGQDFVLFTGERYLAFRQLEQSAVQLTTVRAIEEQLRTDAIDPLDKRFTLAFLTNALKKKRSSIKTFLVDGQVISGIGSIYSDEILYAASIHPAKKASSLSDEEIKSLYEAINDIVKQSISCGGVRVTPLFASDSLTGSFSEQLHVYGKENNDPNKAIELITVAKQKCYINRSTQLL